MARLLNIIIYRIRSSDTWFLRISQPMTTGNVPPPGTLPPCDSTAQEREEPCLEKKLLRHGHGHWAALASLSGSPL